LTQAPTPELAAAAADWLIGLLRCLMPDRALAAEAAGRALATAVVAGDTSRAALVSAALAELPPLAAPPPDRRGLRPVLAPRRLPPGPQLALLVRTLPAPERRALVLSTICATRDEEVARACGVAPGDVAPLVAQARARLLALLSEARPTGAAPARETAHHLRPARPPSANAVIVVRDGGAFIEPGPENGLMHVAMRALERVLDVLRRSPIPLPRTSDLAGAGRTRKTEPPPPTPTTRPLPKPARTPSLTEYRLPPPTAGTGVHRRSPMGTPSTNRISNPRRPGAGR
jgi:DNA-directed RNA polymerase specialized sigma24 family protein